MKPGREPVALAAPLSPEARLIGSILHESPLKSGGAAVDLPMLPESASAAA
jgi:hypothetical protein